MAVAASRARYFDHRRQINDDYRHAEFWKEEFAKRGIVLLKDITPDVVREIRDELMKRDRKSRGKGKIAPAIANRKPALLSTVVDAACREYQ